MIEVFPFAGLPVAVFGLGTSGIAAANALKLGGAEVWAWDDSEDARARARAAGVPLVDLYLCNWRELTSLVLSPGVPLHHPAPHRVVMLARAAGCEVIGDIELLARTQRDAAYIGITGTNGKSTTTALIGHVFRTSGRPAQVGGNIGRAALDLDPLGADGAYILEMSSYQLELTFSITFDIAVLLNITPDHLDRHGDMAGYIAAKRLIFHRQTKPRTAVIGVDDPRCEKIYQELKVADEQMVIPISSTRRVDGGIYAQGGTLHDDAFVAGPAGRHVAVADLAAFRTLPGTHNAQNAAAAYAACVVTGIDPSVAIACLRSFPGLRHRQETIATIDGIAYVNDSKATNADAAARALACYPRVYWIAGGRAKEGGLAAAAPYFDRVRRAFLIGEAAPAFAKILEGSVQTTRSGDLAAAVAAAHETALAEGEGGVVLLSPACASFDQFANFEARGEAFRKLVQALPGRRSEPEEISVAPKRGGGQA
ncbi:MAG: UDP-N-acetylmuramoyl-L-alanine--D-glutamate ligase [Rhodospirillales bacterium]|nr:UDP-N-acetylmuramoyl-L-alanine--D-glutamate ligase [Rhodospirillales bacterium]MSP79516.1 UDP-N-acetylmuramoyl-L-alanine--D-glutamate ligase [Rhodospirillales bacterium]